MRYSDIIAESDDLKFDHDSDVDIPRDKMPQIDISHLKKSYRLVRGRIALDKIKPSQSQRVPGMVQDVIDDLYSGKMKPKPLIVDKYGYLVNGHHRLDALKHMGAEKTNVIMVDATLQDLIKAFDYTASDEFAEQENKLLDKPTLSVQELADKHDVSTEAIKSQLAKGIKVELEHTSDPAIAKEIALDHIAEFPDYYDRLAKVEETDIVEGPKDFDDMELDAKGKQDSIDYFYHTHAPSMGKPVKAGKLGSYNIVTVTKGPTTLLFLVDANDSAVFYVGFDKYQDGVAIGNVRSNGTVKATDVYVYLVKEYGKLYSDMHQTPSGRKIWDNLSKYTKLKVTDVGDRLVATEGNKAQKGIPANATLAQLDKIRSTTKDPEKRKRAHWLANMRRGSKK